MTLVNIIGCLEGNYTGYGIYTRGLWTALQRYRSPNLDFLFTEFRNPGELSNNIERVRSHGGDVKNVWLQVGPGNQVLNLFAGEKIAYTMYEASALPLGWAAGLNALDRVFTPSQWGKTIMAQNGVDAARIQVVPGGVDAETFNFWGPKINLPEDKFKFLMVGKYEVRKGYDEALCAFKEAFGEDMSVMLLLKATSFVDKEAVDQIRKKISDIGVPQAKLVDGALQAQLMGALYRSCDCLIYPSRGEGWGLPLIEAMASGLPVLTTNCSGHSEFLKPFEGRFGEIECDLAPLVALDHTKWYQYEAGPGDWYIPNLKSLTLGLQKARCGGLTLSPNELALDVMSRFSWDSAAQRFLATLLT